MPPSLQCGRESDLHVDLRQISHGCCIRANRYNGYDVNGYRLRSKYSEKGRPMLTTNNTGVCVRSDDDVEYFGVIEDIIVLTFEGPKLLEIVLLDCHWFDPTCGVKRTDRFGLVEIDPKSKLSNYEPFVMAHQVTQVYYTPYACQSREDLCKWWVVHHVHPRGINLHATTLQSDDDFFQEDGLQGTLEVDIGSNLDNLESAIHVEDEVVDPGELEILTGAHGQSVGEYDDDVDEDAEDDDGSESNEDDVGNF